MSKMGLLGAIGFSLVLVSLTQIPSTDATSCKILSAAASGPSSILIKWEEYPAATSYFLDLRVKSETKFAPVVVTLPQTTTEWNVQGLRPGLLYTATVKVFQYYYVVCRDTVETSTGPDTSQIKEGKALTSHSAYLEWGDVPSTDNYILTVSSQDTGQTYNLTFSNTNTSTVVENLRPSTHYDFHIYTVNNAGMGDASTLRTITTLAQPPENVTAIKTGDYTARVYWSAVENVLMYKVSIQNLDDPTSTPFEKEIPDTKLDIDNILPCSNHLISVSSLSQFLVPSEPTTHIYSTNTLTPVSSVSADYSCNTNSATIHWSSVTGADSYRAKVTDKSGAHLMCTDQGNSCQISGLSCGQIYTAQVIPLSANCENPMSNITATFHTVHCPPGNLSLVRECESDAIHFSWAHLNDTEDIHYMALATNSKGEVRPCITEDNNCYFTNMGCGQHYEFTVSAASGTCKSQGSAAVDTRTAPCVPTNLQTSSDCKSEILLSTWDLAEGALRYTVEASGNQGVDDTYNCSSESNSCAIEGIKCGEHLTVYVTAYDDECYSPSRLGSVADTGPCNPQNVSAVKDCGADSITVSWTMVPGAIVYVAFAKDSDDVIRYCNAVDLSCKIKGLKCSTNYTVYMIASNLLCNSSESQMLTIETDACPPSNIGASLDCAANEAHISWHGQPQIHSYTATVEDEDQVLLSCSSSGSNCTIPNLKCGTPYALTVRYHDGICPSIPSTPIIFDSVPCGPDNIQANVDCASGGVSIDWDAAKTAEGYLTVVSDSYGQTSHNTSQPMLSVNTMGCGHEYTVTVKSFNHSCISFPSVLTVREAPCAPTNVMPERNCGQSFMDVAWQASLGAESYTVSAVGTAGILTCVSNETSCSVMGVMCGQTYNVSVAAVNDHCTGPGSTAVTQTTAPCPPALLSVSVNCSSNSVELTWNSSPNAVSYTGKAVSTDGHSVTCDTGTELSCHMDGLHCGEEYAFTVSASDGFCQTPESNPVIQKTAPCLVQNVLSSLNCSTNTLTVSWTPESIPLNYSVTATPTDGSASVLRCISEDSSCSLMNLECGEQYTVTVQGVSNTCEGLSSVPEIVNSAPCVPISVQGMMECSTHTLHASWDALSPSSGVSYISTLSGAGGFSTSCSTADKSCIFPDLQCAQTYMLYVVAVNHGCNSSKSEIVSATTAPCDPTSVTAALDCASGVATVTWGASDGANRYTVLAEANGHVDSCNSIGTSCDLTALQCGEDYTVTVLAGDGKCNSSVLATTSITTAPCAPVIQAHDFDCVSNHAVVTWAGDEDARNVTVVAVSTLGHSASCSSSSITSCTLEELQCGHTYTVHAVAQGVHCWSQHSTTIEIVTAPCTPSNVAQSYDCDSGIATVSWDETMGRQSFCVHAQSGDHTDSCSDEQTHCSLTSLLCGHTYDVAVIAVADHCNSSVAGVTQIETAPCAPTNVSASLLCDDNAAAVSWQHSAGAVSYTATAICPDGDVIQCTTNETTCHLPNMHCGETYNITVSPFSTCKGDDSPAISFITGPCPPSNIHVSMQCAGNVGLVTWDAALQAEQYVVATLDDHGHNCTSSGTSCSLTDLHCGETSTITVVAIQRGCTSNPSLPFTFQSVICPPTNVMTVTSCINNDITVSWDPSGGSGVSYYLHSEEDGGTTIDQTTLQTSHVMTGLQCDESYTITITATDSKCTSGLSTTIRANTAPCPPTNLNVTTECGTNLGILTWDPSPHAISYTATATGTHGHKVSCSSNTTSCSVKLDCGHAYSAVVFGSSASCNGSAGNTLTFISAPCLPDNVVAHLDCNANSFAVEWRGSIGSVGHYTAIAIGSDDTRLDCNSTTTDCTIENLQCGVIYSIVVTTPAVDCGVIEGSDYMVQSAPCKPDNVMVSLECGTHSASVTWENSGPNQTQVVTAVDSAGVSTTCNSSSSNCTFDHLTCGDTYVINVVGHTNSCSSDPPLTKSLKTAPCAPTNLRVHIDCVTGAAMAMWNTSLGATSYIAYAHGSLGHNETCSNTITACQFSSLECGQEYSFTVVGLHDSCAGLVSETVTRATGPCPHSGLTTTVDCKANTATVSWTPGSGILYYNASAAPTNSIPEQSCSTGGSSCNITSLLCGETYIVSVSGQGTNCPSQAQEWDRISTAPCPPTNLRIFATCASNDIMVMWEPSQGSASYLAVAEDAEGGKWSCNTSSSSCQISQLPCGQEYHVYAVGVGDTCFGDKSNIKVISTGPCVPQNIQHHLDCQDGVLNITWESTGHSSLHFCTSLLSSEGHVSTCVADQNYSVMSNLQCDMMYNVSVMAMDSSCNSTFSPQQQILTAPCAPLSFLPTVDCSTGVVSVTLNDTMAGVVYSVAAVDKMGHRHNCTGTTSGCDLSSLDCGTQYNITIVPSRGGCVGTESHAQMITTVPCIPMVSGVEIDCLSNSAWLMYNESTGAEDYVTVVTDSLGAVQTFACNDSSGGVCSLPELACSENLTFALIARDHQCSSPPSNAVTSETAPCPPENVATTVSCDNATVSINWSPVFGAVMYKATLEDMNGHTTCCTTADNSCTVTDLMCGEFYTMHLIAEGRVCNSSQSEIHITRTVLCIPQNLEANLRCTDNLATMSWDYSKGWGLYRVSAVSADGHEDECVSFEKKCELTNLLCGQLYTAVVTVEDQGCKSQPSNNVTIRTAPCIPESISSVVDCEANALVVSWSESAGADSYIATVEDSNGQSTTCLGTTEGGCNMVGIGCGLIYRVSVFSSNGVCNSPITPVIELPAVPCEPAQIQAYFDCPSQTAMVSWYESGGALSYAVNAVAASDAVTLDTNMTHSQLEGLHCGESYSVSVSAVGHNCSRTAHLTGQLLTGPCIPANVTTVYDHGIGQVMWDSAVGADNYTVEGLTAQGLLTSCNTSDNNCALYGLQCGQLYNISVSASNEVGMSIATNAADITTEPCPPNNVEVSVDCQTNTATVTWETNVDAVGFMVQLTGQDGHSLSCYNVDTYCDIEDLHCGVTYYTSVIAIGETLNSTASNTVSLIAAPCATVNAFVDMNCDNNSAVISWNSTGCATSYIMTAVTVDGYRASCETADLQCQLTELRCGLTYTVSLTSVCDHCQAERQTAVTFSTRPCTPLSVGVDLQCGTGTANLFWEEVDGVELYVATATCSMGTVHCNSTNTTCVFPDLHCGETYEFSVIAHADGCCSETSETVTIQTGPCQPSGLMVNGSCYNDTVVLDWSAAAGASLYLVEAMGDLGYFMDYQTNETWIQAALPCGQLYSFTVKVQDDRCNSETSLPVEFQTSPCVPMYVQSHTHCEDSIGLVSWAASDGAESYLAFATGQDGHDHMCTTNTTSCMWDDLHCGEVYTVHVIANDYMCSSSPSDTTSIRMAPCIPQGLISSMNCSIKVGSLTWNATETADLYLVTAESSSGHKVQLSTNDTWTYISEFQCDQEYYLSVQSVDSECTSQPSQPSLLKSEPCRPTGVSGTMNCLSNIALVSWIGSSKAAFYTATITLEDGQSKSCLSAGEPCGISNVECGKNYTLTVVASYDECNSDPSEPMILQSVPCVPTDMEMTMDCSQNEAVVTWSASDGALFYHVIAQSMEGDFAACYSPHETCNLRNLTCGRTYIVQIVAEDNICPSLSSPSKELKSVPCTPAISEVVLDCVTNSVDVAWTSSEGALSYTATARPAASSGDAFSCSSNSTNCEVMNVDCGTVYNVIAVASNEHCDSPPSISQQVESAPCPPANVEAVLNCSTNTVQVEWQASAGADSYIVQALGVEERDASCETTSQSCLLSDLMCGCTYNVSVLAVNDKCNVSQSAVTQLQAVPCVPQMVEANLNCESGDVAVSWEASKGALSYTAVAQGNGGYASACNSSEPTCTFSDLLCGLNYSVTVSASDETCRSAESSDVDISSLRCVPQQVSATMLCGNATAVVSWDEGEVMSSYLVRASGPDGHMTTCNSDESSCQLHGLHCGQLYNLTVTALDGQCDNSQAHLDLLSVPCTPTHVQASLQCDSNTLAVTWEQASGAVSYVAVGVTADGSHRTECNSTVTHCDLSDLQCGQTYSVTVFSHDESCSSAASDVSSVNTAPCTPQNVIVSTECAEGALTVSWAPNPDAQYFHALAVSKAGARPHCNSTGTSCTINNLPCGQKYNVTVLSVKDGCVSQHSTVVKTYSAPCSPHNATGNLDCVSNSATVMWETSEGAHRYLVSAEGSDGHNVACTSTSSHCEVPDLNCGTRYIFQVTAANEHCHSNKSSMFELVTGPCALDSVSAETQCDSDTILVGWDNTADATDYVVTAENQNHTLISCHSSSDSCLLENITCDMQYSIIVSASSDKCSELRSPPRKIKTAPCVPHNVTVEHLCEENAVVVTWGASPVAISYQLTATGDDGHTHTYNSLVSNYTMADLHCGHSYNLSITASGDNCTSMPYLSSFQTVPCTSSGLVVNIDCQDNSAVMSWSPTEGAVMYYGCAQPVDGDALYCESTTTSCTFEYLECGNVYNFSVEASNGVCNGSFSEPVEAGAVPCPPTSLKVRMQRIEQRYWAMTTWDHVNCSHVEYNAEISGLIQNNPQAQMDVSSYWLPRQYFEFPMPCSTAYNFTVRARNSAGVSMPSTVLSGVTAPCPPQNVRYTSNGLAFMLSWDMSVFATMYTAYSTADGNRTELCSTTGHFCLLREFNASASEVTASNDVGESNPNGMITAGGAGRRRRDFRSSLIQANLEQDLETPTVEVESLDDVSMLVKWTRVEDATVYTLVTLVPYVAQQDNESVNVKSVNVEYSFEYNLKSWTTYCFRVAAKNALNQSSYSKPVCKTTGGSK